MNANFAMVPYVLSNGKNKQEYMDLRMHLADDTGAVLKGRLFFSADRGEVVQAFFNEESGGEVLSYWKL